jgi:hypothetical protein
MTPSVAFAAAEEIGFPPNVEIESALSDSATSGVALGHRHDLGLDVPVRDAEPGAARPAEARLHLVADEDAAVLPHDPHCDFEILVRRRDEAADALDRLGDEAGDPAGGRRPDQLLEILRAGDLT